jgi:hypothetical protein
MAKRLKANDPLFKKLREEGRLTMSHNSKTIEELAKSSPGSKYGNKPVSKNDIRNPYDRGFASEGEFQFQLMLDEAGIKNEPQVNLGMKGRNYVPGATLNDYRITIDWFLPDLNVYLDFKGAVTDRALWQFRLLADRFIRDFPCIGERPYICTVNKDNGAEFIALAKKRGRFYLSAFIFDLKPEK